MEMSDRNSKVKVKLHMNRVVSEDVGSGMYGILDPDKI